jgi:hypothetical protein
VPHPIGNLQADRSSLLGQTGALGSEQRAWCAECSGRDLAGGLSPSALGVLGRRSAAERPRAERPGQDSFILSRRRGRVRSSEWLGAALSRPLGHLRQELTHRGRE